MDRITGDDTTDLGGGKRGFRGRNMLSGLRGTVVAAQWLNDVQEELLAVIENAGIIPGLGLIQLVHAIRSQRFNYAQAGGTADALTVSLSPALAAHVVGMPLRVRVKSTNTGDATLNAGPGVLPIRSLSGQALEAGDLIAGTIVSLVCTGEAWTLVGLASRTATETRTGLVELATNAETQAGTDVSRAVTPAGLASRTATETRTGLVELATGPETATGEDSGRAVTPLGLLSRTATETRIGLVELATLVEAIAGTDTVRAVTPAGLSAAISDANPTTLPKLTIFTASGTWTKTAKARKALVIAQGPGGAGGGDASGAFRAGAGGGAGACAISLLDIAGVNSVEVTVSAGGVGVANDHGGSGGGSTSFGALVVASPGQGGSRGVSGQQVVGGLGGQTATANIRIRGASGMHPTFDNSSTAIAGSGGASFFSGGGRGASNQDSLGPGDGMWGSGGGGADVGGTSPAGAGGNGGNGLLIVVEM